MTMHSQALALNAAQLAVQEIIFIDRGIADFQLLALGVKPGIEVHLLEANAIAQITTVLAGRSDITTVHIISHGSPGCLYLGNETLELNNLSHHSASIKQWFATAQETPQLLLYGCNVAVGDGGQEFLDKLHQLTGAKLFASSSLTGNSALGGDWDLQAHVSSKQAVLALQAEVMARYGHVLAPTISNLDDAAYTEQAPAITLDSDVAFSGGGNYSGGSIQFSLSTADNTDNLTLIDDGTASTTNGVLSIVGTTVFLGDGTNAAVVGSVDSTLNGQNGQPLKINFSNEFENGDFNLGTPGQTSITGWTTVNQRVVFGTDTIAGLATPIDNTIPAQAPNADRNTPSIPGTMVTVLDGAQNDGGGTSVRLTSSGIQTQQGFDIVRGPYIYSNGTVALSAGDQVSFEWQAQGGGDAYDVYGYIVDVNTGNIVTILDETGNSDSAATTWATETVTVSTAGDYRFVFVAGTYDFTGGRAAGAQLFIDDVTVTQAVPPPTLNDSHISEIAQSVQYSSTSDNPDATKTLTIDVENGASETASDTAIISITPVDDAGAIAGDTSATGSREQTLTGTVTGNDPDGLSDGTIFSIEAGDGAANGPASIDPATGAWSYTPNANFSGSDAFTVTLTDDQGGTTTQVVSLTVNDPAVITGDTSATGDEEATLTGTLSATDTEGLTDGTIFSIETDDGAANGSASVDPATGTWSYTPNTNFSGSDAFTVTITDDQGGTTTQVINLTVNAVDDVAVVTGNTSATGDEEATLTGTLNATDAEGLTDGTYFSIETGDEAENGIASIDPETGAWSYVPNANFNGSDEFTVTITDDQGSTTTQVISLTVNSINDLPVLLVNQLPVLEEGETVTLTTADLNASDVDHSAEDLIYTISDITQGQFSGEGVTDNGDGTISFTQAALDAGQVQFTHDGSEDPHSYSVSLRDGSDALATTLPQAAAQPTGGSFTPTNDAPSFAGIPSAFTLSRAGDSTLEFTVADVDNTFEELTVTATSTNGDLFPEGSLSLSGTGNSRTLSLSPSYSGNAGQSAVVNLSLSDGEATINQDISVTLPIQRAATDVDIDGTSEILWRSRNDSSILMWKMQDNGVVSQATFAATIPDMHWNMAGTDDFDGDDQLDLIGRNQETGEIKIWLLDANQQLKGEVAVAPQNRPGQDWQIVGIDDFNGDDTADILWRHQTSGQFLNWYLGGAQGGELTGGALFDLSLLNLGTEGVFPDLSWKVEGTGDFNDDNAADIVWRHQETNQISIWHMDEQATLIGGYVLDGSPDSNWEIVGSGDFDGNGKSDLFWKHKTAGETAIWSLDQGVTIGGGALGSVDLNAWKHFV